MSRPVVTLGVHQLTKEERDNVPRLILKHWMCPETHIVLLSETTHQTARYVNGVAYCMFEGCTHNSKEENGGTAGTT